MTSLRSKALVACLALVAALTLVAGTAEETLMPDGTYCNREGAQGCNLSK